MRIIIDVPILDKRGDFMTAIQFLSLGRRLANLYAALCAPICRQYGINQTGFDILLFCANNPEHNTARDLGTVRGIKRGIASICSGTVKSRKQHADPERLSGEAGRPAGQAHQAAHPDRKGGACDCRRTTDAGALRRHADRRHHAGRVCRFAQHNAQVGELPEQCLRIGRG